jgi:hypothetical protein
VKLDSLQSEYLTSREAAMLLRCTPGALSRYRRQRCGPPFLRVGTRVIRYLRSDLIEWLEGGRVSTTEEPVQNRSVA